MLLSACALRLQDTVQSPQRSNARAAVRKVGSPITHPSKSSEKDRTGRVPQG
jgi:hypothetical protein